MTTSVIFWVLTNFLKLDANYLNTKIANIPILNFICLSNFKISSVNDFNKQVVNTSLPIFQLTNIRTSLPIFLLVTLNIIYLNYI